MGKKGLRSVLHYKKVRRNWKLCQPAEQTVFIIFTVDFMCLDWILCRLSWSSY